MRFALQVWCLFLITVFALAGCQSPNVVDVVQQRSQDNAFKAGENTVPFRASVRNTIQVVPPFPPPIINAIFEGEGKSQPFGMFEFFGTTQVDVTVFPFVQTTDFSFTFRNGDVLNFTSSGTSIEDPPGQTVFSGEFTIVGGTGRFANASGGGTYAGSADVIAAVGQFDMGGNISGFGGN